MHLTVVLLLLGYSAVLIAVGGWIGRRVKSSDAFFVAGRSLGPGLLFATLLAANIGAGSTVGAAGLGYRNGIAAWWWVGSAAVGSAIMAFWIGPRMRREAAAHGFHTVGDYLEHRFSSTLRGLVAVVLWLGTLAILAGQLIAMSTLLTVMAGMPMWVGCVLGGVVITVYFSAGGLVSSAWVNVLQLSVKLVGFALAIPAALSHAGGWQAFQAAAPADPGYWDFWANGSSGWMYVFLLTPAFIVSPGLLQKVFGARDDRTTRLGVGLNALGLVCFAAVPPLLGMMARVTHPALGSDQLALPTLLLDDVPPTIGAFGLAAIFSAEVSAADAILFMLATSLSQDLYKRFVNREADDRTLLRVARLAALAGGVGGIAIALVAGTIVGTLSFFYSVLSVCLFVPIVGGLYVARLEARGALLAVVTGTLAMLALQVATGGKGMSWVSPAAVGLVVSVVVAALTMARRPVAVPLNRRT